MMNKDFFEKHPHGAGIEKISRELHRRGHRAVLAGGCVRDALLGRPAEDLDVATDATPEQIESYFEKVVMVGKSFGVCRVVLDGVAFEVATFRQEGEYLDGRRPETITYATLDQDVWRRDFTVNAMFFDLQTHQLIDLTNGQADLQARCLRAVGNPQERFAQDHLRILRGARFAAQLGFEIEPQTWQAMKALAPSVQKISWERIQDEFKKAFKSPQPNIFFDHIESLGLSTILFPKWSWDSPWLKRFFAQSVPEAIGWSALFFQSSLSSAQIQESMKTFKFSGALMDSVQNVLEALRFFQETNPSLAQFVLVARGGPAELIEQAIPLYRQALQNKNLGEPWLQMKNKYFVGGALPVPLVGGSDLQALSISPGPAYKKLLDQAFLLQLENPSWSKELLLQEIQKSHSKS